METNTKILLGVLAAAGAGAGYYFLVYKPKKDKEAAAGGQLPQGAQTSQAMSQADRLAEAQRRRIQSISQQRMAFAPTEAPAQAPSPDDLAAQAAADAKAAADAATQAATQAAANVMSQGTDSVVSTVTSWFS